MYDRSCRSTRLARAVRSHRRTTAAVTVLALAFLALALTGCIRIMSVTTQSGIEAGPDYVIQLAVKPAADLDDYRGTLAFRHPNGWEVTSVTYAGSLSGTLTRAAAIENYFDVTWEAVPVDATHNGPKAGYTWWAGYGPVQDGRATQNITVTIHVDTHGVNGVFQLDFVTGLADAAQPANPAANGDGAMWSNGGDLTDPPRGAVLNRAVSLLEAQDPEVVSSDPAAGAEDVAVGTDPHVTFSEEMASATINGTNLYVRLAGGGGAKLPATVSYNATTRQATIDLDDPLDFETDYLLVVESDVKDLVGYTMQADYVAPFTTAVEPIAPQVVGRTPAGGATGVSIGTDVTATFAAAIDPTTLDETSFILERSQGGGWVSVPSSVAYSGGTTTAILDPDADLAYETVYRATLTTGIQGENGLPLPAADTWTFTTAAAPAPTFIDVTPGHRYYDAITGLAAEDIIVGYEVSPGVFEFRPDAEVWRAQFAKMIVGALVLQVAEDDPLPPFTDLGPDILINLYPHEFVGAAYTNGITTGKTATTFAPYDNISRAQVVTMVVRAMQNLDPGSLAAPTGGYSNTWGTSFSSIHGPNARIAEFNGLLVGLPLSTTAADPWAPMPRGEVAQVLWNMMAMIP